MIVGVPDGLGAYLYDDTTVRAICQSEVRVHFQLVLNSNWMVPICEVKLFVAFSPSR